MTSAHESDESCPKCWAALQSPLFCDTCESLLPTPEQASPYVTLGLEPAYALDRPALRKRLLSLSRRLHPDFHAGTDSETRAIAEKNTAELNAAFEVLEDDVRRADWLVRSLGGPDEREERQMPPEFLAEVLEWNEVIEEARDGSGAPAALESLAETLRSERSSLMEAIERSLTPLPTPHAPQLTDVRKRLNALRYIDRALGEIEELELKNASAPH